MEVKAPKDKKNTNKNQSKNLQNSDDEINQPNFQDKLQTKQGLTLHGTFEGDIIMYLSNKNRNKYKPFKQYKNMLPKANQRGSKSVSPFTTLNDGKYSILCNFGGSVAEIEMRTFKVIN